MVSTRNFNLAHDSDIMRMCLERVWGQQEGFQKNFISLASSPTGSHPHSHAIEQRGGAAVLHIPDTLHRTGTSLDSLFVVLPTGLRAPPTLLRLHHFLTNCGWLSPLELQEGKA